MSTRWWGIATLVVGGVLLLAAWLAASLPATPLYDGLGLPTEPYRYLQPPSGQKAGKPPTSADVSLAVGAGTSPITDIATQESPAQAQLHLDQNAVKLPTAGHVTFTIRAVSPPSQPGDGTIDGNVYRMTAQGPSGTQVALSPGTASINLRGTTARGSPVIEEFVSGRWVRLKTAQFLGVAIYTANVKTLGDFALVLPGAGGSSTSGSRAVPFVIAGAVVLVIVVVVLLLVRVRRVTAGAE